jgi:hypothetical protein
MLSEHNKASSSSSSSSSSSYTHARKMLQAAAA